MEKALKEEPKEKLVTIKRIIVSMNNKDTFISDITNYEAQLLKERVKNILSTELGDVCVDLRIVDKVEIPK